MTGKELWEAFAAEKNITDQEYEAWAFGTDADLLAALVLQGEKTATASAYPLYKLENEPIPAVGVYSVILDGEEQAVCVIQTTKVTVMPFDQVPPEHAYKEGEGDKTLDHWRRTHEAFFADCMQEAGLEFTSAMPVVCEEFEIVYQP